ncbi:MAG: DEAD/DEAH box helicase, partial [Thermodesulfovibrionales bacterium]
PLYLTNIHQLYENRNNDDDLNPVDRIIGPKPKKEAGSWEEDMLERVKKHDDLLILNDEAHHVHDTDLVWYKIILGLHENLKIKAGKGVSLNLDFSATPKDQNGTFYPWIICDYPLAQAIEDRIVKAPLIVHQTDRADPEKYSRASVAYGEWINIAISRWKEHNEAYGKVGKKPVLFIMAENTKDADDIYQYLQSLDEFKGRHSLLIHTDKTGEVSKKDLEVAREVARSIDRPDNKIRAVVSVLMLREGWDVQNVSVILGLRPFTSKANILPEQAVGRGLRLMRGIGPDYIQIVEIIGTQRFEEFIKSLEVEGVGIGVTTTPPSLGIHVYPMKVKAEFDISLPVLTPSHKREFGGLEDFDIAALPENPLGLVIKDSTVKRVELIDTVTQKKVGQVTIDTGLPEIQEILGHLTTRICKEARIEGHFAVICPVVKKYLSDRFFGTQVDLEKETIRRHLSDSRVADEVTSILSKEIGKICTSKTEPEMKTEPMRLIEIEGFYWRRDWVELEKTVFNVTPCYNEFEKNFGIFLDNAHDITKFAKLAETYTRFYIEYLSARGAIRYYYPDFVAEQRLENGRTRMWLIETKGQEDQDVPFKDARAKDWCENVSKLTGTEWQYLKVPYEFFTNSKFSSFNDLFISLIESLKSLM